MTASGLPELAPDGITNSTGRNARLQQIVCSILGDRPGGSTAPKISSSTDRWPRQIDGRRGKGLFIRRQDDQGFSCEPLHQYPSQG